MRASCAYGLAATSLRESTERALGPVLRRSPLPRRTRALGGSPSRGLPIGGAYRARDRLHGLVWISALPRPDLVLDEPCREGRGVGQPVREVVVVEVLVPDVQPEPGRPLQPHWPLLLVPACRARVGPQVQLRTTGSAEDRRAEPRGRGCDAGPTKGLDSRPDTPAAGRRRPRRPLGELGRRGQGSESEVDSLPAPSCSPPRVVGVPMSLARNAPRCLQRLLHPATAGRVRRGRLDPILRLAG